MESISQDRKNQYRSALYIERAGLTVRVIPVLMALAALFAVFFLVVYSLLGRPMQWLVMLGSMGLTFFLFSIAYVLARMGRPDIAVYIVVVALNQLGAGGAVALQGWFAMSVLLAYVGLACARLFTGRSQNWVVVVITTISILLQILLTYFGPIGKYTNPIIVQILLWAGYSISGIFVVGFISDIQDKRQEQLLDQAGGAADQLQSQTNELEKQTVILQRRTDFLISVIKVIQDLGNPRKVADMVKIIVQSIQEEFGFYHVAFYKLAGPLAPVVLVDTAGDHPVKWKNKNSQIMLDARDPIAEVARLGRPLISSADDRSTSHLADVKSRVTIPIGTSRSAVNGVLDIQDSGAGSFHEAELLLLQMLGEQLSLALEATNRYENINQRLAETMRASREHNLTSWREWMRPKTDLTFHYHKDLSAPSESSNEFVEPIASQSQSEFSLPLTTVQGDILGQITAHKSKSWNAAEITLLETLIEQVEQTLENARLFESTERRAVREQMTRRITDNIRSAVTVEDAIRRAVTQLATAVDASEVSAQLRVVREAQAVQGDTDE